MTLGSMSEPHLLLKWGSLKAWDFTDNDPAFALFKRYAELGMSESAMMQHDTPEQIEILCEIIDLFDGPISNDWDGKTYTKEQAKAYIKDYAR